MAGKLNASQYNALAQALLSHETHYNENAESAAKYNLKMADAIQLMEGSGLRREGNNSWRHRLATISSWLEVQRIDGFLQLIDRQSHKFVISDDRWESAVKDAWGEVASHGVPSSKSARIKAISDQLKKAHSMDSRRFGIPASYINDVISKERNQLLSSSLFLGGSARPSIVDGGTSIADNHQGLDVHYFLSVHKQHVNAGFIPWIHISDMEPVKMSRDIIIPEGHFGQGLITYCAILRDITPGSGIKYKYELQKQNANEDESQQQQVLPDHVDGNSHKREVVVGSRRLYVCDEFGVLSRVTYKRYNSVSDGCLLNVCWEPARVKERISNQHVPIIVTEAPQPSSGRLESVPASRKAEQTYSWALSDTSRRLKDMLCECKTCVAPTPRVQVAHHHVNLNYHCHRGPAEALQYKDRKIMLQSVPPGCPAPQKSVCTNLGCNWSVSLRYPPGVIPTHCPVHGTELSGKWRDKIDEAAFTETPVHGEEPVVKCSVYNMHSGHIPGSLEDKTFLPVSEEVVTFANDLLSWGLSPHDAQATIAMRKSMGHFPDTPLHRTLPDLRELQNWSHSASKLDWTSPNSWQDMLQKVSDLEAAGHIVSEIHPYNPDHTDPNLRGFKLFVQHKAQQEWISEAGNKFGAVFIDATHGTNQYGMQLVSGAVQFEVVNLQDNQPRFVTIPLWHFLYSPAPKTANDAAKKHHNQRALNFMMQALYKYNPDLDTNCFIMDKDETEHNAIVTSIVTRALEGAQKLQDSLRQDNAPGDDADVNAPLCMPPRFPQHIVQQWTVDGEYEADSESYLREISRINSEMWSELGGYANASSPLPPGMEEDMHGASDGVVSLPSVPTPEEYTEKLLQDVKQLIKALELCDKRCKQFDDQQRAWLKFQDSAADFILRHYTPGGVPTASSTINAASTALREFVERYLLITKILCEFHVKKAWKEALQKHVKVEQKRDAMYSDLDDILHRGRTRQQAQRMIEAFTLKWTSEASALSYCQDHWFTDYWLSAWAPFGRRFQTNYQNTTLPLERLHSTLKYTIMGGIVCRRPGGLIDALFGAPGNHRLLAKSMVAFYGRRLQEAHESRHRGRIRAMEKRCGVPLRHLWAAYQVDEAVCCRIDDHTNVWRVKDNYKDATFTVLPDSSLCLCPKSKGQSEYCAHLLLVDKVQALKANGAPEPRNYTMESVIPARDPAEVAAAYKHDIIDLFNLLEEKGEAFAMNTDSEGPYGDSQSASWLFNLKSALETAVKAYDTSASRKRREPEPERDSEVDTVRPQQYNNSGLTQGRHQRRRQPPVGATAEAPKKIGDRIKRAKPKPTVSLPQRPQNSHDAGDDAENVGGDFRPLGWATLAPPDGSTSRAPSEERND